MKENDNTIWITFTSIFLFIIGLVLGIAIQENICYKEIDNQENTNIIKEFNIKGNINFNAYVFDYEPYGFYNDDFDINEIHPREYKLYTSNYYVADVYYYDDNIKYIYVTPTLEGCCPQLIETTFPTNDGLDYLYINFKCVGCD